MSQNNTFSNENKENTNAFTVSQKYTELPKTDIFINKDRDDDDSVRIPRWIPKNEKGFPTQGGLCLKAVPKTKKN